MYTGKLVLNFYRNNFLIFIIEASQDAWRHWNQTNLGSQNSVVQALFIFTLDKESSHKFSRPKKRMMWPVKYMTKFMKTLFRKLMLLTMGSVSAMGSQGNTVYFLQANFHTRKKIAWSHWDLWYTFKNISCTCLNFVKPTWLKCGILNPMWDQFIVFSAFLPVL